jgi:hypothetical protein
MTMSWTLQRSWLSAGVPGFKPPRTHARRRKVVESNRSHESIEASDPRVVRRFSKQERIEASNGLDARVQED